MSSRMTAIGIFLLAFAAFAWLAPQIGRSPCGAACPGDEWQNPQVVTRLGLALSIVQSGRLDIDRFADYTFDKAIFDGHYYSDKFPGLSFLAVPVVAAGVFIISATGGDVDSDESFARLAKTATIAVNGFISAVATGVLFLTALHLGATRTGALFAAGVLAFATPFFGWSTAFFAHSVSGSLLMIVGAAIAFAFADYRAGQSRLPTIPFGLSLGVLLGYTLVVDPTAAPACLIGGALTLALAARLDASGLFRMAVALALGGFLGVLPLLIYNQLAFGSPFTLGYSMVVDQFSFESMGHGFFGIAGPKADVVLKLLFGLHRGLLPLSPILLLVPVGLYLMWRDRSTRIAAGAILVVFCSFLWINASYYLWNGGWSTGPRLLVPMLPLCCLPLAFAWPHAAWGQAVTLVLLTASLVVSLVCAAAGMFAPSEYANPLVDFLLPIFLTPERLLRSLPIVLLWGVFGLLFYFPSNSPATQPLHAMVQPASAP